MRFNRFLHLIAFSGKAHRRSPASGRVTTKMLDAGAPSQAKRTPDFSRYIPLSGGGPPDCSKASALGPPSENASAHWPMVWASLSNARATAAAVQPRASSHSACHLSRSRGVGARYIRRRTSASSIRHRSSSGPISIMPNSNPHSDLFTDQLNHRQFYPTPMRVSPWLRFR